MLTVASVCVCCVRVCQVKNKSAALVQITAEQLLREAQEFREEITVPPRQEITDPAELKEYMGRKRKVSFADTPPPLDLTHDATIERNPRHVTHTDTCFCMF